MVLQSLSGSGKIYDGRNFGKHFCWKKQTDDNAWWRRCPQYIYRKVWVLAKLTMIQYFYASDLASKLFGTMDRYFCGSKSLFIKPETKSNMFPGRTIYRNFCWYAFEVCESRDVKKEYIKARQVKLKVLQALMIFTNDRIIWNYTQYSAWIQPKQTPN